MGGVHEEIEGEVRLRRLFLAKDTARSGRASARRVSGYPSAGYSS